MGKQNSNITCIDETALNLLYKGKYSTKILVNKSKFFPHDKRRDKTIPKYNQLYFFRIAGINIVKTDRKTTNIPIYGGASRIGWSPQYVGTLLEKLDD